METFGSPQIKKTAAITPPSKIETYNKNSTTNLQIEDVVSHLGWQPLPEITIETCNKNIQA